MTFTLVFGAVLAVAVLLSSYAHRTVLSTTVLFLTAGFVVGPGVLGLVDVTPSSPFVHWTAEIALFTVLYTDAMRMPLHELRSEWRLTGRVLVIGMPLVFVLLVLAAHMLVDLPWEGCLLLAAVLTPTDPLLAEAIVGRRRVPWRVRRVINVESGLNDGLALPVVLVLVARLGGSDASVPTIAGELALGVAVGISVPWALVRLERLRFLGTSERYRPLLLISAGLLVFGICGATHANPFLAAFAAGATVATTSSDAAAAFDSVGGTATELLKLAAVMLVGALILPSLLVDTSVAVYAFALFALLAARPISVLASLLGTTLDRKKRLTIAWFGPKGFASVTYALLVLREAVPWAEQIVHVAAITIAISIVAHSSTDVLVAGAFRDTEARDTEARDTEARDTEVDAAAGSAGAAAVVPAGLRAAADDTTSDRSPSSDPVVAVVGVGEDGSS